MNVSIIIPNYNGEKLLKKNLPKVIETANSYKDGKVEVIVVDDGSFDRSVEEVRSQKSEVRNNNLDLRLLQNKKNLGFSSTVNRGVKEARGEVVVLLNTDVSPEKDFLEPLLMHFKDQNVFAVGCMDKSIEGRNVILRGRGIGEWKKGFLVHSRGEVNKTNTLWVNGGSGAFRKSIWEKLGGFDELYNPFYWEDIDLSYRAQKVGYEVIFEPKSVVVHEHGKGSIYSYFDAFTIKKIAYRNQFIFVWENITDLELISSHFFWLLYYLIKAILRLDLALLIGFTLAIVKFPDIILKRKKQKKIFIRTDRDVLKEFL